MTAEPKWLTVARAELAKNIHEFPGEAKDNPEILKYYKATGYDGTLHDEVPWCAAFVNWCLKQAGIDGTNSAAAASFGEWGVDIGDEPKEGCIVLLNHHVTIFLRMADDDTISCLGGNQHDSVKISNYLVANVISYRWPKGA